MPAACFHPCQTTGHGSFPPTASLEGSGNVNVNGNPALIVGNKFAVHCDPKPTCHPPTASSGSGSVFINGQPACRIGDDTDCGDAMAGPASTNVIIGG